MSQLLKLVKTYRLTPALDQAQRLAGEIFIEIRPKLRAFVYGSVNHSDADDVLQEASKAIAASLRSFTGHTEKEFWAWCYRIARNKRSDHFRRRAGDRTQATEESELAQLIDHEAATPIPGASLDLDRAMKLLDAAKPDCRTLLWAYYVQGFDYAEIAEERAITYDAARMQVTRCLDNARTLIA